MAFFDGIALADACYAHSRTINWRSSFADTYINFCGSAGKAPKLLYYDAPTIGVASTWRPILEGKHVNVLSICRCQLTLISRPRHAKLNGRANGVTGISKHFFNYATPSLDDVPIRGGITRRASKEIDGRACCVVRQVHLILIRRVTGHGLAATKISSGRHSDAAKHVRRACIRVRLYSPPQENLCSSRIPLKSAVSNIVLVENIRCTERVLITY